MYRRFWPFALILIAPLILFLPALFTGQTIGPFDQLRTMSPWTAPPPSRPWNVLQADGALQFYGWRDLVFQAWRTGDRPFWNPFELFGTPLLANSQSGALYPPHIVAGMIHLPTGFAVVILAWLHLAWAGAGVYFLVRTFGGTREGGALAGVSFALSTFMVQWTPLASVIETVSWIPWLLAGLGALLQGNRRPVVGLTVGASVAMMLLAGHLQFAAYGFMAAAVLVGSIVATAKEARAVARWAPAGLALLAGGLIAAPQLLPVISYSGQSHRRNTPSAEGYRAYLGGAIKPFEVANLATPYALGNPAEPVPIGKGSVISSYWPPLAKQGANLAESAITLGPLVLVLLALVPWRNRALWPLIGVGLLGVLVAFGTPLNQLLYFAVPGWSSTGSPGRAAVLFVLAACTLAGFAVSGTDGKRDAMVAGGVLLISALLAAYLGNLAPPAQPGALTLLESLRHGSSMAVPTLLLLSVLLVFLILRQRAMLLAMAPIVGLVFALSAIPTGRPLDPVDGIGERRVAIINDSWDLLTAAPALIPPNLATQSRIYEAAGYDSLLDRDTKAILDEINGQDSAPPANGNMMFIKPTADPQKLTSAGVSQIWTRRKRANFGTPNEERPTFFVYELPGERIVARGESPEITRQTLSEIELEIPASGTTTLKDRGMQGWQVKTGTQPVNLKGGRWLQITPKTLGVGPMLVTLAYVPPGYETGKLLALLGFGLAGGLWFLTRRSVPAPS